MAENEDKNTKENTDTKYTKEQLLKSKRYADNRDVLSAVLKDNNSYTLEIVDKLIKDFKRKRVK